jgi:hypothetical protein
MTQGGFIYEAKRLHVDQLTLIFKQPIVIQIVFSIIIAHLLNNVS